MKKFSIYLLSTILFFIISSSLTAQHTVYNDYDNVTFRNAIDLFQKENYGSALTQFDNFMKETNDRNTAIYEDAAYYSTICAINLKMKDSEKRVERFIADYPTSASLPLVYFELGNIYFDDKKYASAIKIYQQINPNKLEQSSRDEYYYKKGYCQMKKSQYDAALASYGKVMKSKSNYSKPASYYYSIIQYQKGNYSEALEGFRTIANDRKFKKYVPLYLVKIHYQLGNYENAIKEGMQFIDKAKRSEKGDIAGILANSYYNLEDYDNAYNYFKIYEQNGGSNQDNEEQYRIGYCKFMHQDYQSAISNFQNATKAGGIIEQNSWYYLGYCYLNTQQYKFAQNAFLKTYQQNSNNDLKADALFSYVKITIERGNDSYNDPVTIIEEFIESNPGANYNSQAYDLLSQLYLTSKNYSAALQSLEKVKKPNSRLQGVYQQLAYAQGIEFFNRRAYNDAIEYFNKSLNYPIDSKLKAEAIFWKADSYYRLKQYDNAARYYNSFLKDKGASNTNLESTAIYNSAYCAFNRGRYADASWLFRKYLKQSKTDQRMVNDSYLRLADSYLILKDYKKSLEWYDKVIDNNSADADYALYQKAISYGSQGNFKKKINTLQTLENRYKNSQYYDEALYEIASTNLILNDQRHAISYFDKLVKQRPKSSLAKKALVKMGFLYYSNNQYDQAVRSLRKVIDSYPASLEAKEALTTLQNVYMDMGQVDKYIEYANSLDFIQVSTSQEDSLKFVTGENHYINQDCNKAIVALTKYTEEFPNGGFVITAYHYLTDCYEKKGDAENAIVYYKRLLEFPDNQYTEMALLKVARSLYNENDFQGSYTYYERLSQLTDNKMMMLEAKDGIMKSAWKTGNIPVVKEAANELLKTEKVNEDQLIYAHYLLGMIAVNESNYSTAERELSITSKLSKGEFGAEALYNLAYINYRQNKLNEAEEIIYQIPEKYPSYDYWIAKGFILLADIYVGRENNFQAEQTLISVIENHKGEELRAVAKGKLERLQASQQPDESENESDNQEN